MVNKSYQAFEGKEVDCTILKQALRKSDMTSIPDNFKFEHIHICDRVLCKAGLDSYLSCHEGKQSKHTTLIVINNDS